jgi:hypothetical protein
MFSIRFQKFLAMSPFLADFGGSAVIDPAQPIASVFFRDPGGQIQFSCLSAVLRVFRLRTKRCKYPLQRDVSVFESGAECLAPYWRSA